MIKYASCIFLIVYINTKVKKKQTKYIMDELILSVLIFIHRELRQFVNLSVINIENKYKIPFE